MDALPEWALLRPKTLAEAAQARAANPKARLIGGGTDLLVNIRRGIEAPAQLIDMTGIAELRSIATDAASLELGAAVTLAEIARHPGIGAHYPVLAEAAH